MQEALDNLPPLKRDKADLSVVFPHGNAAHLKISYSALMESAVRLRRKRIADTRAEAIEAAYDTLIRSATDGKWVRVGEVHINRQEEAVTALCVENDEQAPVTT